MSQTRRESSAKYTILLPAHDHHHNVLKDLGPVCWQWIEQKIPRMIHHVHVEGPHAGHRGSHRHLKVLALDTPEADSHMKQLAAHVGELCNRRYVTVSKEGARGAEVWRVSNNSYNGGPAHPAAIAMHGDHPTSGA